MKTALALRTLTSSFKFLIMNAQNNNTKHKYLPTFFNIATHNTRSFLDPLKQQLLVDLYSINHLNIVALQETNFANSFHCFPLKTICNNNFISFFSTDTDTHCSGFGVGFLVKKYLADHIFHHSSYFNRIFCLDFQFKNKNKFRVINIYLSCSDESFVNKQSNKCAHLWKMLFVLT